ncbi:MULTISPECIES: hypothetical protein [unclassified Nocardioides]|uniref:hypothetical protein n=1 Tax=unclassified Nocardioides TaxID=2615069 RepID=UPI00115484A2|nr:MULTISPECIES: hypothetical protein [unclassified Nocardioides]WGX99912.1 hypothetical protein QI633_15340 [Nocardioides sp. QY071]
MDVLGARLGVLCLAIAVLLCGCAAATGPEPDLRTPPVRDTPPAQLGDGAGDGADGLATP